VCWPQQKKWRLRPFKKEQFSLIRRACSNTRSPTARASKGGSTRRVQPAHAWHHEYNWWAAPRALSVNRFTNADYKRPANSTHHLWYICNVIFFRITDGYTALVENAERALKAADAGMDVTSTQANALNSHTRYHLKYRHLVVLHMQRKCVV
jgi:hypothetical protein